MSSGDAYSVGLQAGRECAIVPGGRFLPFRIGDRVVIAGITGDVTAISLTHVILNQVGGSVGGEEKSGCGILIPNAILFQHTIINYTLEQEFMLDEVLVRLTFDSDWEWFYVGISLSQVNTTCSVWAPSAWDRVYV